WSGSANAADSAGQVRAKSASPAAAIQGRDDVRMVHLDPVMSSICAGSLYGHLRLDKRFSQVVRCAESGVAFRQIEGSRIPARNSLIRQYQGLQVSFRLVPSDSLYSSAGITTSRGSSMTSACALALLVFSLPAQPKNDDAAKKDLDKLQGTWTMIALEAN